MSNGYEAIISGVRPCTITVLGSTPCSISDLTVSISPSPHDTPNLIASGSTSGILDCNNLMVLVATAPSNA